jgi:UDP-glucuronate 4-epimerase
MACGHGPAARAAKSVLVTGAAGFIGSHLTERCLGLGWNVLAVDAFTDYYAPALKRANALAASRHVRCTLIEADLLDIELEPLLDDVSIVFHLAAQPGVRLSWDQFECYEARNVMATQRLLEACRAVPPERFVFASSSSIYGDAATLPTPEDATPRPISPYGVTKMAAEQLARIYWQSFGIPAVCLRYFTVYGPRQRPDMALNRLITCALSGRPFPIFGDGAQTRDFTFVSDAVTATIAAGEVGVPGSVYNIGGGSARTLNSVIDTLADLVGRPLERSYASPQTGDARCTAADVRRARHDLGFEPTADFAAGLTAQLDWQLSLETRQANASHR